MGKSYFIYHGWYKSPSWFSIFGIHWSLVPFSGMCSTWEYLVAIFRCHILPIGTNTILDCQKIRRWIWKLIWSAERSLSIFHNRIGTLCLRLGFGLGKNSCYQLGIMCYGHDSQCLYFFLHYHINVY